MRMSIFYIYLPVYLIDIQWWWVLIITRYKMCHDSWQHKIIALLMRVCACDNGTEREDKFKLVQYVLLGNVPNRFHLDDRFNISVFEMAERDFIYLFIYNLIFCVGVALNISYHVL